MQNAGNLEWMRVIAEKPEPISSDFRSNIRLFAFVKVCMTAANFCFQIYSTSSLFAIICMKKYSEWLVVYGCKHLTDL